MVDLGHQVSELQAENEQLGKENGELKLTALHSSPSLKAYQGDRHRQNPQVNELQDKVEKVHTLIIYCALLLGDGTCLITYFSRFRSMLKSVRS